MHINPNREAFCLVYFINLSPLVHSHDFTLILAAFPHTNQYSAPCLTAMMTTTPTAVDSGVVEEASVEVATTITIARTVEALVVESVATMTRRTVQAGAA